MTKQMSFIFINIMYIHIHIVSKRCKGATASSSLSAERNSTAVWGWRQVQGVPLYLPLPFYTPSPAFQWALPLVRINRSVKKTKTKNDLRMKANVRALTRHCQSQPAILIFRNNPDEVNGLWLIWGSGTGRKPPPRLGTCREAKLVQEELKIFQSAWRYKKILENIDVKS